MEEDASGWTSYIERNSSKDTTEKARMAELDTNLELAQQRQHEVSLRKG